MAITDYTQEEAIQKFKDAWYSDEQINAYMKKHASEFKQQPAPQPTPEPTPEPKWTYDSSSSFDELTGNVNTVWDDEYQLLTNEESKDMYGNLSTQWAATKWWNFNPSSLYPTMKALWNAKVKVPPENWATFYNAKNANTVRDTKAWQYVEKKAVKELTKKEAKSVAKNAAKVAKDYIKRWWEKVAKLVWKVWLERAMLIIWQAYEAYRTFKDTEQWWVKSEVAEDWYWEWRWLRDFWRTFYAYMDNTLFWLLPNLDAVYNKWAWDWLYWWMTSNYEQQKQAEKIAENMKINDDYSTSKKYWKEVKKSWDGQAIANSETEYLINTGKAKEWWFTPEDRKKLSKLFNWKEVPLKDWTTRKDRVYVWKNKQLQWRTLTELWASWITFDKIQ